MTSGKHHKRLARARRAKTGESYTTALRHLRHRATKNGVMSANESVSTVFAKCSFCGKSSEQVKRLVAGPGIFICEECVALCDQVIGSELSEDQSRSLKEQLTHPTADDLLTRIRDLARAAEAIEADLQRWVLYAIRDLELGWEQVAAQLEQPADDVRRRFDAAG